MIVLVLALGAAEPAWTRVGETTTRLRVFYDRNSIRDVNGHRKVQVRIGAPIAIIGRVVIAYQDDEIDCTARTWRQVAFDARDETGSVVQRSDLAASPSRMLPALKGTIGGAVVASVCAG